MLSAPYVVDAVQQVRCVNCGGTSVVEWAGAIAGVVGGVAAVAAWVLAARSARDSSRSADAAQQGAKAALRGAKAAEEELKLMRAEIEVVKSERERRASFAVRLTRRAVATITGGGRDARPVSAVMCFGISDIGTRPAERVLINLLFPRYLRVEPCGDEHGNGSGFGTILTTDDDLGRGEEPCIYWAATLPPLDIAIHYVSYVRLIDPPPGIHPIKVKVIHNDLPDRLMAELWEVVVPASGGDVSFREQTTIVEAEPE